MKTHQFKKSKDKLWIALIIIALVVECVWLLVDLNVISLPFASQKKIGINAIEAGYVMKAKEDLRRRSADSLVWEKTSEKDTLYYRDSLLTLSEGSARLYLKDQTELQLSENTLVTLEEPDDKSTSEIRLRFSRGDLRARNPVARANIVGDDWLVNLERGAEVSLRKDKDSYEFEVLAGKAFLETNQGRAEMTPEKILKLSEDKNIQQIEKSSVLEWNNTKAIRVYSLGNEADVALEWKGKAKNLILNKSGESEKSQPVSTDNVKVSLQLGSYKVRLQGDSGLSQARDVEIWKAPRIILKKPLPRDRLKVGDEVEFVWTGEPGVKSYRLKVGDRVEEVTENFKTIKFEKESDLEWKVEGLDEDGNVIPASYESKVFLRNEPLQAPRLKTPTIKSSEKEKPSSQFHWWSLFLSQAFAAVLDEVVFEWEKVDGAEFYIVEISNEPDFRNLLDTQNVKATSFIWKKYDRKKRYFWRVASGASNRRMGYFSEPQEVKPQKLVEKTIEKTLPTTETKTSENRAEKESEVQVAEPIDPDAVQTDSTPVQIPSGFALAWAPTYKLANLKGEANSKIGLGGGVPVGLLFEVKKSEWHFQAWTASQVWKPKPESEFPFQKNLSITETRINLVKDNYGIVLYQTFVPMRLTDESISFQSLWLAGVRYQKGFWGANLLTSGSVHELSGDLRFRKYITSETSGLRFFYGGGADATYQLQKQGGGYQMNLIFLLGADSF